MYVTTFIQYLKHKQPLSLQDEVGIRKLAIASSFKKTEYLPLKYQFPIGSLLCVVKGVVAVRCNVQKEDTETIVRRILSDGAFYFVIEEDVLECMEETVLVHIPFPSLLNLIKEMPVFNDIYINLLRNILHINIDISKLLSIDCPCERVKLFYKRQENLYFRVSNKLLALYLKMAPETYCRMKKKMLSSVYLSLLFLIESFLSDATLTMLVSNPIISL